MKFENRNEIKNRYESIKTEHAKAISVFIIKAVTALSTV